MTSAYHRKKQPELVRRNLIEQAIRLMAEEGLHAVTVQAVSDAAGVSKGGFMHHFSSKHALVEAAFAELLAALDADLAARMAAVTLISRRNRMEGWPARVSRTTPPKQAVSAPMTMQIKGAAPIASASRVEQLPALIAAAELELTDAEVTALNEASQPFA